MDMPSGSEPHTLSQTSLTASDYHQVSLEKMEEILTQSKHSHFCIEDGKLYVINEEVGDNFFRRGLGLVQDRDGTLDDLTSVQTILKIIQSSVPKEDDDSEKDVGTIYISRTNFAAGRHHSRSHVLRKQTDEERTAQGNIKSFSVYRGQKGETLAKGLPDLIDRVYKHEKEAKRKLEELVPHCDETGKRLGGLMRTDDIITEKILKLQENIIEGVYTLLESNE